jgi:hypothetical protein
VLDCISKHHNPRPFDATGVRRMHDALQSVRLLP